MQRILVALQRQDIIAALLDDLCGNGALAIHRVSGDNRAPQREHLQSASALR